MPGGGFDTGFDVGFDIGTDDAARLPTWFRGAPAFEFRPANVSRDARPRTVLFEARPANVMRDARPGNVACEARMANLQQPAMGWIPGGGGVPMPPLPQTGALLFENGDRIQMESGSDVLLLG
jgi:hypothetical protein